MNVKSFFKFLNMPIISTKINKLIIQKLFNEGKLQRIDYYVKRSFSYICIYPIKENYYTRRIKTVEKNNLNNEGLLLANKV